MDRATLINAIAAREGTAKEIAKWYDVTVTDLKRFVEDNREVIELAKEALDVAGESTMDSQPNLVTPTELAQLWIGNKYARLQRYELVADLLFRKATTEHSVLAGAEYATVLRELRFYMTAAANELGQLLHRGAGESGDGDTMGVDIVGINPERLQ